MVSPSNGSNGFGIKPNKKKKDKAPQQENSMAQKWAIQLHNLLKTHRQLTTSIRTSYWKREFEKLQARLDLTDATIQEVLDWYEQNYKGEFIPVVRSAKSFRERFPEILDAKLRQEKENKLQKKVELTPEGKKIVSALEGLYWPRGSNLMLPDVVEQSLVHYQEFISEFTLQQMALKEKERALTASLVGSQATLADIPKEKRDKIFHLRRLIRFADFLWSRCLSSSRHFVEGWFRSVNRRVIKWDGWVGDLRSMSFYSNADWFHVEGREWAVSYGDVTLWPSLWSEMGFAEKFGSPEKSK